MNRSGGSGRNSELSVKGADRRRMSTGTKSIAWAVPNACVPWLGTRLAGLFWTSQRPVNG